jgi:hypothetical protein
MCGIVIAILDYPPNIYKQKKKERTMAGGVSTLSAKSGEVMLIRFFASLHMPETAI